MRLKPDSTDATRTVDLPTALPTNHLWSIGAICSTLQVMPGILAVAARDTNIAPSLALDGVAYFSSADVDGLAKHISACAAAEQAKREEQDDEDE